MASRHRSIADMHVGDHYCGIYRTDEEHRTLVLDFVRNGISRREKMFYIVNLQTASALRTLLEAGGIDVAGVTAKRQLTILTTKEAYLRDGEFDPAKMLELLEMECARALNEGYAALRVTGEMTWALAGEPGSERLIEYEARLNTFFPGSKCYAVCQYDQRRFDSEALLDILHTHPRVLYGLERFDNERMYYVPPDLFLSNNRQTGVLNRWLGNLSERPPKRRPGRLVR